MTIVAVGTEIRVSTTSVFYDEYNPQVTTLSGGGFAVTWAVVNDKGHGDIRGRVFAADGTPVNGSEFLVSNPTKDVGESASPQIAALADGGFAVMWGLSGRVFMADGTPVGPDFLIYTTSSSYNNPQITALADGGFAVTWMSFDDHLGVRNFDIRGRVFAADGTPVNSSDFLVSTTNVGEQENPQITALADGGFAVTWISPDNNGHGDIRGRVFAADGTPVNGSDFVVPTNNFGYQRSPEMTALADGGFAVMWYSPGNGTTYDIRGRVFAADGTPVNGSDFLVSTTNWGDQYNPQITALADGGFAVTLASRDLFGNDEIRGRVFAADGTPVNGSDFLVSTANHYDQEYNPQITALADGGFAVTWWDENLRGRVFAADGTPVDGSDFLAPWSAQITALADGGFAVTWQTINHIGNYDIRAQVFTVNEAPAVTTPGDLATHEDSALVINGFTVDDPDHSQLTVTLTSASTLTLSQIDGLAFTDGDGTADHKMTFSGAIADINAALAGMTYAPTTDFNGTGGFDYTLDDGIDQISGSVAINVDAVNDAPTITSNGGGTAASVSVAENSTAVAIITALDPDAGQTPLSYSIIGGADAAKFTIDPNTGALRFITAPNFEAPTDMGGNNIYDVTVHVSDGHGGTDSQAIAVTVTNANETPTITSNGGGATASVSVAENSTAVTTVTATEPDAGQILSYSISGADADKFAIDSNTGALRFITAPSFEAPTDVGGNNIYDVTVHVSDGYGGTDSQAMAVTVTNANDAPTITSNGAGAAAGVSVAENTTAVTTVTATDPDAGQTLSYSISGGADAAKFTIGSTTGALSFITAPNFELPTDVDRNNIYDLIVQVSDGNGGIDTEAIAVTVTDVENTGPIITSNGGGDTARISIVENSTAVATVTAAEPDAGQALSYAIAGGPDASKFAINAGTGALSFITAPNFEAPTDSGHNNVYDVTVQVSDGAGGIDTQALSVSVQNVSDPNAGILWQNSVVGTPALWLMDGLSPTIGAVLPNPGPAWHVVDAGDFNGDGNDDIIWQGSDGTPAMWLMDDDKPVWVGAVGPFNPGPSWEIKGTGDFNGDGNDDILWQGSDGTPAVWMMNGSHVDWFGAVGPFNPGPNWEIKGTGDFNGDGDADILWQGSDGTPAVWMMDGTHVDWLGTVGPFNPGPNWEIKGTGDFNGDGRSDILWQGSDGTPAIWLMDGASAVSVGVAGSFNPGPSWEVKGAADVNGDGNSDILWQGSNGTPAVWLMDGLSATAVAGFPI